MKNENIIKNLFNKINLFKRFKKKLIKKHYHFIGIGGISMSALAKYLANENNIITGSDISPDVKLSGIETFVGHNAKNLGDCDVVVYNSAISSDNPEMIEAKKRNVPIISRAEMLAEIGSRHKNVISISGIHGKTTTTEMIAEVFIQAGLNPTVHLGGISNCFCSNLLLGDKKFFITEACEYKNSFLSLKNKVGVILNLEPEHLDFFKTFNKMKESFKLFANSSETVVAPADLGINIKNCILIKDINGYTAKNVITLKNGKLSFDCYFKGEYLDTIILNAMGIHNISNALACIAVSRHFKIDVEKIKRALNSFKGVKRRMEIVNPSPLIIHDYAHHPTELNATIEAIKNHFKIGYVERLESKSNVRIGNVSLKNQLNSKRLYVVFQPHTYSRTDAFKDDFIKILNKADKLYLYKTYPAREKAIKGASAYNLYQKLHKIKKDTYYYKDFSILANDLKKELKSDTILLILGAGDIEKLNSYFKEC
ncbi:MAG: UDP-N-acetylmuramate--L-alanine ligase [Clostridia bacterium]|nr:UDP-N-acetylmuramate--L-alanine ligase [Clostridia bacterium]